MWLKVTLILTMSGFRDLRRYLAIHTNIHIFHSKTERVGPIADRDFVMCDDVGVANIINSYTRSVFTNDKLPIPEPLQIFKVLPMIDSLIFLSPKTP